MSEYHENVVEWITGDDEIAVTVHQKKFVNKILKLSQNPDNGIRIISMNDDGSIFARMPIGRLNFISKRTGAGEEEKAARMARLQKALLEKKEREERKNGTEGT